MFGLTKEQITIVKNILQNHLKIKKKFMSLAQE
jgi:hypothetical protein